MKPLSIVAYFDGRPGHEKQTLGILAALAEMTVTEVTNEKVTPSRASFVMNWASYILSGLRAPEAVMPEAVADLIIGTGTHTHIPMLLAKKARALSSGHSVPVVTCMTPDPLLINRFDLCCVPAHDEPPAGENIFITLGPPNTVKFGTGHRDDKGLILIGGIDRKSHTWDSREVVEQVRTVIEKSGKTEWTVSSSPRTPEETSSMLEELAAARQRVTFFRSADTHAGWVEQEYARSTIAWVTADSVSMIYEALTAGCSVGILPVNWLLQDNKFNRSLAELQKRELIVTFSQWQAGAAYPKTLAEPFNEAARCAREILKRWWPERLPR